MLPMSLVDYWAVMVDKRGPESTATQSGAALQHFLIGDKRWPLPMERVMG